LCDRMIVVVYPACYYQSGTSQTELEHVDTPTDRQTYRQLYRMT